VCTTDCKYRRAFSLLDQGFPVCSERYAEALEDYNDVLQRDADDTDARFYRGVVLERMGKLDAAIDDFTKVLEKDPNHIKASYARGACQNQKGEFSEAIRAHLTTQVAVFRQSALLARCTSSVPICAAITNNATFSSSRPANSGE
jgi:tetratricopeptide (TPR) repeat protein